MNHSTSVPREIPTKNPKPFSRLGRTLLSDALRDGVPEPKELEPDVLLKGKSHQIFTGPGNGKTWVALWLIKGCVKRGQAVMFLDMENGKRIIAERLQSLGLDDGIDKYLHYYDFPAVGMDPHSTSNYRLEIAAADPHLIVFDSWVGFLAACGLDENSPTNVEEWASAYVHPAKSRDCTVVILDHVPHDAKRSRGATRKKDLVDVQWRLDKKQDFDRTRVGYVQLTREKDREGWLPQRVGFSIGGTPEGFVMERSEGTIDDPGDGLTNSERTAFDRLTTYGSTGAGYEEWRTSIPWKGKLGMPKTTFLKARDQLITRSLVALEDDRYYATSHHFYIA